MRGEGGLTLTSHRSCKPLRINQGGRVGERPSLLMIEHFQCKDKKGKK